MHKTNDENYNLIIRNLQEIIDPNNELINKLNNKEQIKIYWGTATTGKPHIAYFLPLLKIKDFLDTKSCKVIILLADVHAMMDNLKSNESQIASRTIYYKKLIIVLLKILKVDLNENIEFIEGSSFQKSSNYTMDLYRLCTMTTEKNAKKAGSEVVKQTNNVLLSSMIYPLMQALDEEYLNVDVQFGGIDQRKIFTYARMHLPKINYKPRIHLMNPIIQGLKEGKMSSSEQNSKIDLLDSKEIINKKIRKAFQEEKNIKSGLMEILKLLIFPICKIQNYSIEFIIKEENKIFISYEEVEEMVKEGYLHPCDLKDGIAIILNKILDLVKEGMKGTEELIKEAYS